MTASKKTEPRASQLPIGELAYRAYMKAAGVPDRRPYDHVTDERLRRIWAEVETVVANNTIAMMGEVLENLGRAATPVPRAGKGRR